MLDITAADGESGAAQELLRIRSGVVAAADGERLLPSGGRAARGTNIRFTSAHSTFTGRNPGQPTLWPPVSAGIFQIRPSSYTRCLLIHREVRVESRIASAGCAPMPKQNELIAHPWASGTFVT
jgi:hypothetical protein